MTDHEQAALDAFSQGDSPGPDPGPESGSGPRGHDGRPLDTDDGCPWCLAPPRVLSENENGDLSCDLCMAVQPTDTEWYQDGEKIIDPQGASQMYQRRWQRRFAA